MKNLLIFLGTGFVTIVGGIVLSYLFLTSIDAGANFIFLAGAVLLLGAGVFCLFKAANPKPVTPTFTSPTGSESSGQSVLDKNNAMIKEWSHTNEQRDRLQMLQLGDDPTKSE